jgi:hypothetical protein
VWFNNATVGLTAYTSLNKTTNGGINWTALASPVTYYVDGICGRGNEWWVARGSKIYYSSDNGANWAEQYTAIGAFNHINSSRIGSTVWGVRNSGNISRYVSQNSGITPINGTVPDNYSLSQNYPNPFNSMTKVKWQILNANIAKITVFDILGREVRTLVNEKLQPGTYEITFDASKLASGIYFYRLEAGNFVDTKRMILTK